MAATPTSRFFSGLAAPFRGLAFVVQTPRLWPWALVPVLVFVLLAAGLTALGASSASALVDRYLPKGTAEWLGIVLRVLGFALALLLSVLVASALAQPLSGPALDKIVDGQDRALGVPPRPEEPTLPSVLRSLRVSLVTLAVTLALFVVLTVLELVLPAASVVTLPAKVVITALMAAWDLLDYPLSRRQVGVRRRSAWIGDHLAETFGFGLALAALFFIPCVGLLFLPAGVAGATRLVVAAERE